MERGRKEERVDGERMKRGRKEEREDGERGGREDEEREERGERGWREDGERGGREGPQGEVCEILLVVCCLRNTLVINRYVCFI